MYQSIFFPMINYPAPTLPASIKTAVALAQAWDARLTALSTEADVPIGLGSVYSMPFLNTTIDEERAKAEANARNVLADLAAEAMRANVRHNIKRMRMEVFDPEVWAAAARYSDLSPFLSTKIRRWTPGP